MDNFVFLPFFWYGIVKFTVYFLYKLTILCIRVSTSTDRPFYVVNANAFEGFRNVGVEEKSTTDGITSLTLC